MIFVVQMPHLDLVEEAEKLKESKLDATEKKSLEDRALYVKKWLSSLAPKEYKFTILDEPPSDLNLDEEQKSALTKIAEALADESLKWEGPAIHECIHKVKEETGILPKKLFQPLYQIFLGRNSGPQVGWFLSTINRGTAYSAIKNSSQS